MKQASRIVALAVLALSTAAVLAQTAASPAPARPTGSIAAGQPVGDAWDDGRLLEHICKALKNIG